LELAATTVLSTPLSIPIAPQKSTGAVFTADLLSKLEWRRFEELVAAYYSKTGVVATRTKTGPDSPVHIKISWKGEPRPFAYVQCIAHPSGLVDAKPVQNFVAVLAAEDIRRGYVVTPGKFNVAARDVAEEKHITLLPGDIFLEKLNALPAAARAEVMQAISAPLG
jgi:restriction system protein